MFRGHALPAPEPPSLETLPARLGSYFARTWRGRILAVSLSLVAADAVGLPVPGVLYGIAYLLLWIYGIYFGLRFWGYVSRRLLWRIRTKLILSYLFIAVVPVVLLAAFFLIAGVVLSSVVASHLVSSEVASRASDLQALARVTLAELPASDETVSSVVEARLSPVRATHPELSYALVRGGQTVAASGSAPRELPDWWQGPGLAGLVREGGRESLRAIWSAGDSFLILDVPVDRALFSKLEERTGIRLLTAGARIQTRDGGATIEIDEEEDARASTGEDIKISEVPFIATVEHLSWETGDKEPDELIILFEYPYDLIRHLTPGALNTADILVMALPVVGGVFVFMYAFALLLGLLLARSITKSVHALSKGTERLREGDFTHRIKVRSRDQLGELAESFNVMARGIEDLLREQVEKQRLEEELRIARQIQMSLLPQETVTLPGLRVAAMCLPATEVGGDYYDLLPLSETRMGVLVADVSGKGTSAALYMAELKGLILSLSRIYSSPAKLLSEANRILAANLDSRSFITMTYAVVDTATRTMRYARAGHNPMIYLESAAGRTKILTPPGLGLGIDAGERFERILEEDEVALSSGDLFLFFTDGLSEAMNESAELFGEGRLSQILESSEGLGSEQIKDKILEEIRVFVGEAMQHDDMTMVILKVV